MKQITWTVTLTKNDGNGRITNLPTQTFKTKREAVRWMLSRQTQHAPITKIGHSFTMQLFN